MTIRKVSGATSSLVSKAQLVVGTPGITKAVVTRNQLLATVNTDVDIIKAGVRRPELINNIVYDDEGSSRFLRDFIYLGVDRAQLLTGKSFSEILTLVDLLSIATLSIGRGITDTVIIGQPEPDFIFGKSVADGTAIADPAAFSFSKLLADSVGMLSLANVDDGNLFDFVLRRRDEAFATELLALAARYSRTIELDIAVTEARYFDVGLGRFDSMSLSDQLLIGRIINRFDDIAVAESRVFAISKLLADSTTMLDLTGVFDGSTFSFGFAASDIIDVADPLVRLVVNTSRTNNDTIAILDAITSFGAGKAIFDEQAIAEQRSFYVAKSTASADVTLPDTPALTTGLYKTDSQILDDTGIAKFLFKDILHDPEMLEKADFFVLKVSDPEIQEVTEFFARKFDAVRGPRDGFVENFSTISTPAYAPNLGKFEETFYDDTFSRIFVSYRRPEEDVPAMDQIFKFEQRLPFHAIAANDGRLLLRLDKVFGDTVGMVDLAGIFDGNIFALVLNKAEDQPAYEYYARRIRFRRRARDGFIENQPIDQQVGLFASKYLVDDVTIVQTEDAIQIVPIAAFNLQQPVEDYFYRRVEFYRNPWHNDAAPEGSDGFDNIQPISDDNPNSPGPAKSFTTFIPSPTKSDTTSVMVKIGGVSSTTTNLLFYSEDLTKGAYWNYAVGISTSANVVVANPLGVTSDVTQISATGSGIAEAYIGQEVSTGVTVRTPTIPGKQYYFSVWVRTVSATATLRLAADQNLSTLGFNQVTSAYTITTSWQQLRLACTSSTRGIRVYIGTTSSSPNWGDGAPDLQIWGAHLAEQIDHSYVKTTTEQYSGANADQRNTPGELSQWFIDIDAKASTSYSVVNKTVDYVIPNSTRKIVDPAQNSSVSVSFAPKDRDSIGVWDFATYRYFAGRVVTDQVILGSGDDNRYIYNTERTFFFIRESLKDEDGTNTRVTVGLPNPTRVSDSSLENAKFDITMRMRRGVTTTTSGFTDHLATNIDPAYVGSRVPFSTIKLAGDTNETIALFLFKDRSIDWVTSTDTRFQLMPMLRLGNDSASRSSSIVTLGSGFDQRQDDLENIKYTLLRVNKQGVNTVVQGWGTSIVTTSAMGERVVVGDPTAVSPTSTSQSRRSGATLENVSYWMALEAKRGVTGTVLLNTIDPNPDLENRNTSSVAFTVGARDQDIVGTVDAFNNFYMAGRVVTDILYAGRYDDPGYNLYGDNPEKVKFFFIKRPSDATPMLDLTDVFDGLNSTITMQKLETVPVGFPTYGFRVSGSSLEKTQFIVLKEAKQGVNRTFSGNTVTAADLERIYVGTQEPYGFRVSGENLENVRFFNYKRADQDTPTTIVMGRGTTDEAFPERRSGDRLDNTAFFIRFDAKAGVWNSTTVQGWSSSFTTNAGDRDRVVIGDPSAVTPTTTSVGVQSRRSGTQLENISYWMDLDAKRSVAGTVLLNTIDPNPDLENRNTSSVAFSVGARDRDIVGTVDAFNNFYMAGRVITDLLIAGGDQIEGFDRFSNAQLENISYWFNKTPYLDDMTTSRVVMGTAPADQTSNSLNYLTNSEAISTTDWIRSSAVTVTPNDTTYTDPSNITFTATKIQSVGTNAYLGYELTTSSGFYTNIAIAGKQHTFSIWLRADTGTSLAVNISADTNASTIAFNTSISCTVDSTWRRFSLRFTPSVAAARVFVGGGSTFTSGETVYAWGAQVTPGYALRQYVTTTSAPIFAPAIQERFSGDEVENVSYWFDKPRQDGFTLGTGSTSVNYPERRSGTDLERVSFVTLKDAKQSINRDVSGTTVTAYDGDRLFVGQQYGDIRFSGDLLENIKFFNRKLADQDAPQQVFIGRETSSQDYPERRSGDSLDNPAFFVRIDAKQTVSSTLSGFGTSITTQARDRDRVFVGDPTAFPATSSTQTRRSGTTLENVSYWFDKVAKRSITSTVPTQFIDGNNGYVSSLLLTQTAADLDLVGTISIRRHVANFYRYPWHNTYDDVAGAFDDYLLPEERPFQFLSKLAKTDDAASERVHPVYIGTQTPVIYGNLVDNSEDFTNTRWTVATGGSSITVSSNAALAPDGTMTADQLTANYANSYIYQYTRGGTIGAVSSSVYTYSVWLKHPSSTVGIRLYIDGDGAGTNPTVLTSITVTNTWTRFQLTASSSIVTTSNPTVYIGGGSSFTTGETLYAWGAQLNPGSDVTPYVATTSTPVIYTTQSRYSGDELETIGVFFDKNAKRGATGTLLLNTIDPSPDVEYQQSSVSVTRTAWDLDEVGTLDYFSLYYLLFREFDDSILFGSGLDEARGNDLEKIRFLMTKLIGDGTEMVDLAGIYDGNIFQFTLNKRDSFSFGSGPANQLFPARPKGGDLENVAFEFDLTAKQGALRTVSGNTVTVADPDRLFVGQQWGNIRQSGDLMENINFYGTKLADQDAPAFVTLGSGIDQRQSDVENVNYIMLKRAYEDDMTTSRVVMGTGLTGFNSGNLLTYSEEVSTSNGAWIITNGSINIVTNDTTYTNPFGGTSGVTKLRPTTTNRYLGQEITSNIVVGQIYNFSMWVRTTGSSIGAGLYYDPNGGALTFGGTAFTATGTWQRFNTSFIPTTDVGIRVSIGQTSVWDTNEEIFVWGAQVTPGTTPLSYVATTSTPIAIQPTMDRYSGDEVENVSYWFDKVAKRSVTGTVELNTIDLDPDASNFLSSILVTRTAADLDDVGTVDVFALDVEANRVFEESILIGSGLDQRLGNDLEETTFFTIKSLGPLLDTQTIVQLGSGLDQAQGNDLENLAFFIRKFPGQRGVDDTSVAWIGRGLTSATFPERRSDDQLDNPAFYYSKTAHHTIQSGLNNWKTNSGNLIRVTDDLDPVFVGSRGLMRTWATLIETTSKTTTARVTYTENAGFTSGNTYNFSIYARLPEPSVNSSVTFTLYDATAFVPTYYTTSVTSTGWTRIAFTYKAPGSSLSWQIAVTSALLIYGAQATSSQTAVDYIRTTGTDASGGGYTNLINYSEDFTQAAYWITSAATILPLATSGPTASTIFDWSRPGDYWEKVTYEFDKQADQDTPAFVLVGRQDGDPGYNLYGDEPERVSFFTINRKFDDVTVGTANIGSVSSWANMLKYSESISTATAWNFWVGGSITITTDDTTYANPLGVTSGVTKLRPTTTNRYIGQVLNSSIVISGNPYVFSAYVRSTGSTIGTAISVDTVGNASPTFSTSLTVNATGTWTRYSLPFTPTTSTNIRVFFGNATVWDTNEEIFVWGAQVNPGTSATDYVPTTASPIAILNYPDRFSEDPLENVGFVFNKDARRSVTGTVLLNTIDPNPDVEYQQSSVTITRTAADTDDVGTLDYFNLFYAVGRIFEDSITIGSGDDARYLPAEKTFFFIKKQLGQDDETPMLDLTDIYDGINYASILVKAETTTIGRGSTSVAYPERRSGDSLDNPAFFLNVDAKQGAVKTVSGTTVTARDGDRLFVGQQWGSIRQARDPMERMAFRIELQSDQSNPAFVQAGSGVDDRSGYDLEKTYFFHRKWNKNIDGTTSVAVMGRGVTSVAFPERRSDDQLDNPAFFFAKTAKISTSTIVTIKTIDPPSGDTAQSSVNITYGPAGYDLIGAVDYMILKLIDTGRYFYEYISVGSSTDDGYRLYDPAVNPETTKFFFIKSLGPLLDDQTIVTIGSGEDLPRTNDLEYLTFTTYLRRGSFNSDSEYVTVGQTPNWGENIVQYSEQFQVATSAIVGHSTRWVTSQLTVAANSAIRNAPNGTATADALSDNATNNQHVITQTMSSSIMATSTLYTFSVYASAGSSFTNRLFHMRTYQTNPTALSCITNFELRGDGRVQETTTPHYDQGIQRIDANWYRCWVTFATTSNYTTSQAHAVRLGMVAVESDTNANDPYNYLTTYTGNTVSGGGTSTVLVWGAQLNRGTIPLSYTSTTTSYVLYTGVDRRSGDTAEQLAIELDLDAKQGAVKTVSGTTVTARDGDRLFVGQQWGDIRQAGDLLENVKFFNRKQADQDTPAFVLVGRQDGDPGYRLYGSEPETTKFYVWRSIGQRGVDDTSVAWIGRGTTTATFPERRSDDQLDNPAFFFSKTAKRSVTGTVLLNTIDPNPDVEYQQSSVAVTRTAMDTDSVGTLDRFNLFYAVGRIFEDSITIGSGDDARYLPTEKTFFFIRKRLGQDDGSEILDLTDIYDGLNYASYITKRDTQVMGRGLTSATFPERRSGTDLEKAAFFFSLDAKQSIVKAVSGTTVTARDGDRLFIGQQYGNIRFSGDLLENVRFLNRKLVDQDTPQEIFLGSGIDQRQSDLENIKYTLRMRALDDETGVNTHRVYVGRANTSQTFPERRSGDQLDNPAFFFDKRAKQGSGTTTTLSSVTVTAADTDRLFVGQRWAGFRMSGDRQEKVIFDFARDFTNRDPLNITPTDAFRRVFRPSRINEDLATILGEYEGNVRFDVSQGTKYEDLTATDTIIPSTLLFREYGDEAAYGDLDPFGNINNVASNGNLRMTDYVDLDYFVDDYVGEARTFT